ncbi:hypothetical protein [Aquirufa sp. TARAVU-A1A]
MTILKSKTNNFVYFLVACAIIAPKISGIDFSILTLLIVDFYLILKIKRQHKFPPNYFFIVVIWLILMALSFLSFIILGTIDLQFILKPCRQIVLLALLLIAADRLQLKIDDVFKIIIIAAVINFLFIALQLFGHNFWGIPGFLLPPTFNEEVDAPFRKPGLMSGYPHAGLLGLLALQCLIYFNRRMSRIFFVLLFSILTLTLIVTSRTALMLAIIPFSMLILLSFKSKKALSGILLFLFFGVILIANIIKMLPEDTFTHSFEIFLNYNESKSLNTLSTDATLESYVFPLKTSTWLIGNGKYMTNDYNLNVDDGFQIPLFGGGVIYLIITVCLYFYYFFKSTYRLKSTFKKYTISCIFLIVFIANFKLDTIFTRVLSDILTLFFAIGLQSKYNLEDFMLNPLRGKLNEVAN